MLMWYITLNLVETIFKFSINQLERCKSFQMGVVFIFLFRRCLWSELCYSEKKNTRHLKVQNATKGKAIRIWEWRIKEQRCHKQVVTGHPNEEQILQGLL